MTFWKFFFNYVLISKRVVFFLTVKVFDVNMNKLMLHRHLAAILLLSTSRWFGSIVHWITFRIIDRCFGGCGRYRQQRIMKIAIYVYIYTVYFDWGSPSFMGIDKIHVRLGHIINICFVHKNIKYLNIAPGPNVLCMGFHPVQYVLLISFRGL